MNEPTIETLARRLDRVERENRRLKRAGVVALAVIGGVGLMGQLPQATPNKTIHAESFVLVDANGNDLAILGSTEKGTSLAFYDQKGTTRALLGLAKDDSAGLFLTNRTQKGGVGLRVANDASYLVVTDNSGNDRGKLFVKGDAAGLLLAHKNGMGGTALGILPNGSTTFGMSDQSERDRAALTLQSDGSISMALYDENAESQIKFAVGKDGRPGLTLQDTPKSARAIFALSDKGKPLLGLLNKDGKVIWSAP